MAQINPYLGFGGNCREAMNFYKECFGGDLTMRTFEDSPMDMPSDQRENIMHASLINDDMILMGSDGMQQETMDTGNRVTLSVNCDTAEEIERLFNKFSEGGNVTMPLQDTFWGARFGMLTDKYGIKWMFNCEKKQQS